MAKESFVFYKSFYEAIKDVPKKHRTVIYEAVFAYVFESKEPTLSGVPSAIWKLIQPQLDAASIRYENAKKGGEYGKLGAEHGKKGGRPKKEKTPLKGDTESKTENPLNVNVNENVNENVNVNVNAPDGGSDTDTQKHFPTYGEIDLYCIQNGIRTDVKKFFDYNSGRGWPMEWKSALALWVKKDSEKKEDKKNNNRFNDFPQRNYSSSDYEELGRLLNGRPV